MIWQEITKVKSKVRIFKVTQNLFSVIKLVTFSRLLISTIELYLLLFSDRSSRILRNIQKYWQSDKKNIENLVCKETHNFWHMAFSKIAIYSYK